MHTALPQPLRNTAAGITFSREDDLLTIALSGRMDQTTTPALLEALNRQTGSSSLHRIQVDLHAVTFLDDFGALVLLHIKKRLLPPGAALVISHPPAEGKRFLDMIQKDQSATASRPPVHRPGVMERLGGATLDVIASRVAMLTFVGDVCLSFLTILRCPGRLRTGDTIVHMQRVGVDALPIVALISFLLGLIMAFMSAVQLEQFGANIYVASLVSLSMVRELGPIMTAIIVAGRSGSAFAAEIGSMRVAEEVDALTTMGFDITLFLVLPRLLATLCVLPLLTLFSDLFAIAGGLVVGVGMLDLTTHGYMVQTINTISVSDVMWSLCKTLLFALLISGTGCFRGFQVRGGADAVGRATTSAVVTSIFLIILADSILAVIQRYWG